MSKPDETPVSDTSNPVLWTVILVAFVAGSAWWFAYMFSGGAYHAKQHPKVLASGATGPVEPDHATLIADLEDPSPELLKLGKQVWLGGGCTACHGEDGNLGQSGARKMGQDALLNGNDPYSMYLTLVNGYNGMPAQGALSPEEKYAVVAYIRENFFKTSNESQYSLVNAEYLAAGGPNGPFPALGAGEGGPVIRGQDYILEAPVAGSMQQAVDAVDAAQVATARESIAAAAAKVDGDAARALQAIAKDERTGAYAVALVDAAKGPELTNFVALITDPGRDHFQPSLALLSQDQLTALAAVLREGR